MNLECNKILNLPVTMVSDVDLSGYPRFYDSGYDINHMRIGSVDCILISTKDPIKLPTISKMVQTLEARNNMPCIIASPKLTDYQKKRLAEQGTAYIVSPNNLYIPFLGLSILQSKKKLEGITSLSAQAQRLALHIMYGDWVGFNLSDIAKKMDKSLPSVSNYVREIETAVPQVINKQGTSKILVSGGFTTRELFELFEPYLINPISNSIYLAFNNQPVDLIGRNCFYAGMSALSKQTMLADDSWKTYATSEQERGFLDGFGKELSVVSVDDDPSALLQIWKYLPEFICEDSVDDISLYMSLKNSPQLEDPRVEEAVASLRERIVG